jgi:dihydroorotate dehydrogenase electron transfer subunit
MEIPEILEIKSVVNESKDVKTFFFDKKIKAEPGQFLMVWIPRLDEKPFAVSFENPLGITVEKVGPFTKEMLTMKRGDKIGIRGPYGNGFKLKGKNICLVSGGCGVIPLALLAEKFKKVKITAIVGANTKNDLFFAKRLKKDCSKVIVMTDDGSFGKKRLPTDTMKDLLKTEKFDYVYTCGPEIMMKKVFEICEKHDIECQASLERYMKCGFGLCGQCCIDDIRICKDGPVLNSRQLRKLTEFGVFERNKSGKKVYF